MNSTIKCLCVDLKKIINSTEFVLSIVIVAILCFTSVIYTDSFSGKEYTVIEIILKKNIMFNHDFTVQDILYNSVSPYVTLFLPTVSSVPFINVFCTERNKKNIRFVMARVKKSSYYTSKCISAVISSALISMSGFIIYSVIVICTFNTDISFLFVVKIYIGMAFYGAVSIFPAFLLSSAIKNKILLCSFPLIYMNFYYLILSEIQNYFNSNNMNMNIIKLEFLYPSFLKNILLNEYHLVNIRIFAIIYYTLKLVFVFWGFIIIMNRRSDYGE